MSHHHVVHGEIEGPYRFERRTSDRWPIGGVATAFELGGEGFGRTHNLRMIDYSHGGIGASSCTVIVPGTTVSLGFQAPGYAAQRGVVVRCLPSGDGYRVAIAFELRQAA